MDDKLITQRDLAERWLLSEATLERWRTEGIGPMFLKLHGQVRYRLRDIHNFEKNALRSSTASRVDQAAA